MKNMVLFGSRKRVRELSRVLDVNQYRVRSELKTPDGMTPDEYMKQLQICVTRNYPRFQVEMVDKIKCVVEEHWISRG